MEKVSHKVHRAVKENQLNKKIEEDIGVRVSS